MKTAIAKLGFYSSVVAFVAITGYFIVQIMQILHLIVFPLDAILIYGCSLCIALPFMLAMLALHYSAPIHKRIWSHAALLLSLMYAVYACFVYVVQLGVAIPKTLQGAADSVNVLILTEHSFFWTLDALTYLCMGIATLFGAFVFTNRGRQRWARWFFLANALLTPIVALVYFYPHFSIALLMLASPWGVTAAGSMWVLSRFFKRQWNAAGMDVTYEADLSLQSFS